MNMNKTVKLDEELHVRLKTESTMLKMSVQEFVHAHLLNAVQNAEAVRKRDEKNSDSKSE